MRSLRSRVGSTQISYPHGAKLTCYPLAECYARFLRVQPGYAPKTTFIICGAATLSRWCRRVGIIEVELKPVLFSHTCAGKRHHYK